MVTIADPLPFLLYGCATGLINDIKLSMFKFGGEYTEIWCDTF